MPWGLSSGSDGDVFSGTMLLVLLALGRFRNENMAVVLRELVYKMNKNEWAGKQVKNVRDLLDRTR